MASGLSMEKAYGKFSGDALVLGAFALLAGLGMVNLYSASYGYAMALGRAPGYFAFRQLLWYIPAFAVFSLAYALPMDFMRKQAGTAMLVALLLLVLPFLPGIGITRNGASRWFGFAQLMFQPSELFKPALVLYLAHILSKKAERLGDVANSVLPPLVVAGLGTFIILQQNDFSTALLVASLAIVMFWVARVPLVFFLASASVALPLTVLSVLTSPYRLKRVVGFLAPSFDPAALSYQVNASTRAIRAGGLWGKGIGQGTLKLGSIPEVHSDFVFAAWTEETGFVGVLVVFVLWAAVLYRAWSFSVKSEDLFASHLCFGMGAYLGLQVLVNVLVSAGAVPATGIPLPMFSSGGSSLISVAIAAGLIGNATRRSRQKEVLHG